MIRHRGLAIPTELADFVAPERCALLVYDMQVGVLSQIGDGPAVTARCAEALEAARAAGLRVAFSRHLSLPPAWMGVTQMRMAMTWQRTTDPAAVVPWFLPDAPAFAIAPELAPRPDELVFDKITMSAFEGTPLPIALRDCGIDVVAICGVATEIGVEPTARHAHDLGFLPVLLRDACGHGDAEAARRSFDQLAFAGDSVLADVAAFRTALGR